MLSLVPALLLAAGAEAYPSATSIFGRASSCDSSLPASCQNTTAVSDTCCFVTAGQLVATQFWDYNPAIGPSDSWGLHGLWPDYCDSGYPSNCDSSRANYDITDILTNAGETDLLDYMKTYYQSNSESPEDFWEHEWSKHGTCISTLEPDCYDNYQKGQDAVDYFTRVVSLFKQLNTYKILADAGISPDSSKTYTRNAILAPLQQFQGAKVVIGCQKGALSSIEYYFNVQGSLQDGKFLPVDPATIQGSCPSSGIKYPPKAN